MAAFTRKQYAGAAQPTTTTSLLSNVGTSVTIASTTGWPSAAGVPFYVVIEPGTVREEKCLATISSSTLTLTRAQDDTTAYEHASGSSIYPVFTANDADEANEIASKLTTKGDLLATTGTSIERLPVGSNGTFLKADSSASVGAAWSGITLGTDTSGSFVQNLVAGTGITLSNNSGEAATPTISVSGSVSSVDSISSPDFIQFDTTYTPTSLAAGIMQWDPTYGTLQLGVIGGNVALQIGQEMLVYVYNDSVENTTLNIGEMVFISGVQGERPSVRRAGASNSIDASKPLGMITEPIANHAYGFMTISGAVHGLNTAAYAAGDILWLSAVEGQFTKTKPSPPTDTVFVGVVLKANAGNGAVWVAPQNGLKVSELHDASITSLASGDYLKYNGTVWVNDPINLGTDTTGNYVESLVAGTGITLTNGTASEGGTPTINIGQSVATSASPTFAKITISGTPSATTDAVTKAYVDNISAGINWHNAAELATAGVLPNSPIYDNGSSGEGATLTTVTQTRLVVDGTNATTGKRVLVKNQADGIQNGIYDVTEQGSASAVWVLTRSSDYDSAADYIVQGDALYIVSGSTNANQGFILTSTGTGTNSRHTLGTDSLTFSQFTGAANITAGTGITKTGNTLSIGQDVATSASVTFASISGPLTGNASTATKLATARNIAGQAFDGTASITIAPTDLTGVTSTAAELNILDGAILSTTELNYVDGVTGAIQTQIDAKAPSASPTFTGIAAAPTASPGTNTTQIATTEFVTTADNLKANLASPTFTGNVVLPSTTSIGLVTNTEIGYLDGVTSAIQTQIDGKASSTTSPVITLGGDLTGSATLTNLGSATLTATIAANSVALGTDTTGNYMSDLTQGTGVTITHTPGEGSNATIAIGQSVATNANPTFAGATLDAVQVGITSANEIDTTAGNLILDSFTGTVQVDDNVLTTGTITTRAAATQDSVIIQGRAGGTTSLGVTVTPATLSASRTLTLPDTTGTVVTTGDSGTVTSTMIADGTIVNADINTSAAVAVSKLAAGTSAQVLLNSATPTPTWTTLSGDVTVGSTGVTAIGSGVVVNADINASAAIDLSKLASGTSAQVIVANASGVPTYTTLSGDVTISNTGVTAIAANSVALGTDTTGNYMSDLTQGTGVTITHTPGEGSNATIAIGQSVATTASVSFARVETTGNVVVGGNLTINGTTTTVNSTTTTLDDPIITLGGDTAPTIDDSKDRGVEFRWHNGVAAKVGFFGYDDSTSRFTFIPDATNASEVFSGTLGDIDVNNIYINGTAATGTDGVVRATSPTLVTPILGTPQSVTLTSGTGLPISTGVSGLGTGVATFLATPSSANLATAVTDETGSGALVFGTSPTLTTPILGTPQSVTLTNGTGLPISTGVSGLGTGVATFLATPSSANLASAVTDETGSGALVFGTAPTISNLTVSGSASFQGTTILLNSDEAGTPSANVLVEVERGTSTNVAIRWNESTDKWQYTNDGTTYNDLGSGSGGGATASDTAPVSPTDGALWFKSDTAQTFVYYNDGTSSQWVEIGAVSQNTVADILTTTNATLAATQASIEIGVIMGAY
jgi:hypothetical protein